MVKNKVKGEGIMIKIGLIVISVIAVLFVLLFIVYFFNLDMKFIVNVVAPVLEKHYDKRDRNQFV